MNSNVYYFTFEITNKYINKKKTNEINYENGYYISYPYGNYRRYSLKKIKTDINIYKEVPCTYLKYETMPNIKNSSIFKRRNK